jgi:protein TonB
MELKKNPEIEVGRNSSLYFAVGLIVMLLITNIFLQHKTYNSSAINIGIVEMDELYEVEIPITNIDVAPPPPPPVTITENVMVVEDLEEVNETIFESTESNQEDVIQARIVSIEEVKVAKVEEDIEVPFAVLESVPIFPGCEGGTKDEIRNCFQRKILEHVQKNFVYPQTAQDLGIHGKVFVVFVIDKNGLVTKIQSRGPDNLLEKEAERIISLLPKMIPGKQRGKPVRVPYSIPINFKYVLQ